MKTLLFVLGFLVCAAPALAEEPVGVRFIQVDGPRPLTLSVWFPAEGGVPQNVGGNAVFVGVEAGLDAPLGDGPYPLVLVSHGGLRSAANSGAWLSSGLAQAGYVAVEVNGPRPRAAADAVDEIWQRPEDLSRALDVILADESVAGYVDPYTIDVVGFALGGTAALMAAGGMVEADAFIRSCGGAGNRNPDCGWYGAQGVALESVDRDALGALRRDVRIGSSVAIGPEYLDALSNSSAAMDSVSLVVILGERTYTKREALGWHTSMVSNTNVYDAFPVCTAAGPDILAEDGGDPALCGVSAEARMKAHAAILEQTLSFLAENAPRQQ